MRARQSARASETDLQSERVCERKGELSTFAERERECVCVCEKERARERVWERKGERE